MSNRKDLSNANNNDGFADINRDFADINNGAPHNDGFADNNDDAPHNSDGFTSDGLARDIGIIGGAPYPDMPPLQFVREVLGDKPYAKQEEILNSNRDFAHSNNNAAAHNNDGFSSDRLARDIGVIGGGAPYPDMPPLQFVRETLGDKPYDKQEEILRAVEQAANATDGIRRVSVVGCNGSGKDWIAARVILWWMNTRDPAKVVITGPTTRQVKDIVWRELRTAYKNSDKPLRGTVRRAVLYEIEDDDESFAKGFASNSPFNLQGYHSPNMLVVVTEAHAVKDAYMDALLRQNPALILMVGNPSSADGVFYDSHHSKREQYHAIQISAHDTPNIQEGRVVIPGMITQLDIDDRKLDWGEDSDSYINSVLGEFTENPDSVVVPLSVAREAAERHIEPEGEVIVACDVARGGNDKTVVVKRQGGNAEIVHSQRGNDLMEVTGVLKRYCEENHVDTLIVDDVGIGAGVVDRLREQGVPPVGRLIPFNGGARPNDAEHFYNRGAEVWWAMRGRYMDGSISAPRSEALIGQVAGRKYTINSNGRIQLQRKRNLHNSPDEADALAMTFAATPAFKNAAPDTTPTLMIWV